MEICRLRSFGHFHLSSSFVGTGPVQMVSAQVLPPPESSQLEVEFPHTPEGHVGRYCSVVGLKRSY